MTEYIDDIPDLLAHIVHKYNLTDTQLRALADTIEDTLYKKQERKK